jgi:hypothetical protein
MLVYDGRKHFDTPEGSINAKIDRVNASWQTVQRPATCSPRKLACNRLCAMVLLIGLNAITYFAVRAILSA